MRATARRSAPGWQWTSLFRAFGDRAGLLRALYEARLEPIRDAIETGPPPLGPATPPHQRVPALLDAVLCFKLDNRRLALALEESGSSSPYQAGHYVRWHGLFQTVLEQIPGLPDSDFTAHALLAAIRADLVEQLAGQERMPRERIRAQLAHFATRVLASAPHRG
ncbi:TetR/AcrR family transcriptional regulator [Nocardia australiensis]|uniref:TetR/AcrR family transcriptional regulator n=1 Tax=Nocardia australiensis TaxID=2887191 RepID=UPI001D152BB1|nr:TetR/AcrR family transcriptional regulator [Nocardia australiensis]